MRRVNSMPQVPFTAATPLLVPINAIIGILANCSIFSQKFLSWKAQGKLRITRISAFSDDITSSDEWIPLRAGLFEDIYIYIHGYQWRLVTFQPGDAVQKTSLHFLKFYFNVRFFFCKFHRILHHFRYFSKLTLDFLKVYFGAFAQNEYCFVWVREGARN